MSAYDPNRTLLTLREQLSKIGTKVVWHGQYDTFQLGQVAVQRMLSANFRVRMTGLSRSTAWREERAGRFPKRHRISPNSVAWPGIDLEAGRLDLGHPSITAAAVAVAKRVLDVGSRRVVRAMTADEGLRFAEVKANAGKDPVPVVPANLANGK